MKCTTILRQTIWASCAIGLLAALPVAGAATFEPDDQPRKVRAQKIVVVRQQSDGDHKVEIRCIIEGDRKDIVLKIDGDEFVVDSMEEANAILKKYGIKPIQMETGVDLDFERDLDFKIMKRLGQGAHGRSFDVRKLGGSMGSGGRGVAVQVAEPRGFLGVHLEEIPEVLRDYLNLDEHQGVLIKKIVENSAAAHAGIQPNDILLGINRKGDDRTSVNAESLREFMSDIKPGEKLGLRLLRAGKVVELSLKAGVYTPQPAEMAVPGIEGFGGGGQWIDPEKNQEFQWKIAPDRRFFELRPGGEIEMREFDPDEFFEDGEIEIELQELQGGGEFRMRQVPRRMRPPMGPEFREMMEEMQRQMREIEEMLIHLRRQQRELMKRADDIDA